MKPTVDLPPEMLANEDRFDAPFFARFPRRPGPPLELAPGVVKRYQFPTFYADVTCAIAVFLCDHARAAAMMPHPSLEPVRMFRGRAAVLLGCYVYRNVMGIRPYNEIAMTIPVTGGGAVRPPLLPLLMDVANRGYYVFSMPVTSLENQIRGVSIWGLPKVVEEIDVDVAGERCTTRARDEAGTVYFELSVPTEGKPRRFDETGTIYSVKEGRLLRSKTCFQGDFVMSSNLGRLLAGGRSDGSEPVLKLGDSPRAQALRSLDLDPVPLQLRFARSMNSCFDLSLEG